MSISVGTIFKWHDPNETLFKGKEEFVGEKCEDGHCVGIVTDVIEDDKPLVMVKFWEKCHVHATIDPNGTGPYSLDFIWEIGQLY